MNSIFRPALVLFVGLSVICGVFYPAIITGIGQAAFANQAQGSLVSVNGKVVGSALIGQAFSAPHYFWGRPSATGPMPNNAAASSGSNQGPLNPALIDAVKARIDALKAADPENTAAIPVDLVTASASGLDPEISVAAAYYQANRIARARHLSPEQLKKLIVEQEKPQYFGFLGETRVNVLALNVALDQGIGK